MLYIIGLGLADELDISVKGLEAVKRCHHVYLEAYTSILLVDKSKLEEMYGRDVILADREMVESGIDSVLEQSKTSDVAFLVVGDPFGATTHTDLVLRAKKEGIQVQTIHNASIMNAIGACGLQLYRFGETVSIPLFTEGWRPDSFYDKIERNREAGLHTLCLLDIKVKEPSLEAMARGKIVYEPPRFMTVNTALSQLLEIQERRKGQALGKDAKCVGVSRLGSASQRIVFGTMEELTQVDFGPPLHSLVIAGDMHDMEEEFLSYYRVTAETPRVKPEADEEDSERD